MSKRPHRKRDMLQNIAITALVCLAVFLLFRAQALEGRTSLLRTIFSDSSNTQSASNSSSVSSAVLPLHIVVRNGDESSGYLNVTSSDTVFENLGTVLREALGSSSAQAPAAEQDFREALQHSSVCFDFFSPLPMSAIAEWLGLSGGGQSYSAEFILVSGDTGGSVRLFAANPDDGTFYVWDTAASYQSLLNSVSPYTENDVHFAFTDKDYSSISPYTLIPDSLPSLANLAAANSLDSDGSDALLTLLGFNAHSNTRYAESSGTEVIIDGSRTLRISPDGFVSCDELSNGDSVFSAAAENGETTAMSAISAVWALASKIASISGSDIYLAGYEETDNGCVVRIGYRSGGYPIASSDGAAMTFNVENGIITSFSALCRSYSVSTESSSHLLPIRLASAAAPLKSLLTIGYFDSGSSASAAWLT